MTLAEPQTRRFSRDEYYRMAEQGYFNGQCVQLLKGEILQMPPQGHAHFKAIHKIVTYLESIFGGKHWVRPQGPLNALEDSEPEPDVAVTEHDVKWYKDHPAGALLVVEVADTSLHLDRRKAGLYAATGIPEYWILNLNSRKLEVYRTPVSDQNNEFGYAYSVKLELGETDYVSPLAKPDAKVLVREFVE
jgi:Uma2 family endonuclease